MAAATHSYVTDSGDKSTDTNSGAISQAQYQHLLDMITKQTNLSSDFHHNDKSATVNAFMAGKFCLVSEHYSKTQLLIDSGATDHICSDLKLFTTFQSVSSTNDFIIIPDGRKVPVKHIGTVPITEDIVLHNVLHVPDFQFHLVSVQRLCKDLDCTVIFSHDTCVLQGTFQNKQQMLLGRVHGGLYKVNVDTVSTHSKTGCSAVRNDALLWHLRLGHLPYNKIKLV